MNVSTLVPLSINNASYASLNIFSTPDPISIVIFVSVLILLVVWLK